MTFLVSFFPLPLCHDCRHHHRRCAWLATATLAFQVQHHPQTRMSFPCLELRGRQSTDGVQIDPAINQPLHPSIHPSIHLPYKCQMGFLPSSGLPPPFLLGFGRHVSTRKVGADGPVKTVRPPSRRNRSLCKQQLPPHPATVPPCPTHISRSPVYPSHFDDPSRNPHWLARLPGNHRYCRTSAIRPLYG